MLTIIKPDTAKPMTSAMAEVDAIRDGWVDAKSTDSGVTKIWAENRAAVVYTWEQEGKPIAIMFVGRAKKPTKFLRYQTPESRATAVQTFFSEQVERAGRKSAAEPRTLKVGDVLRQSYGYEQTNIDYFMVTELVGRQSVKLVEIGKMNPDGGGMSGRCAPDPNKVIGEPFVSRAKGDRARCEYKMGTKVQSTVVAGATIYETDYWSSYH